MTNEKYTIIVNMFYFRNYSCVCVTEQIVGGFVEEIINDNGPRMITICEQNN